MYAHNCNIRSIPCYGDSGYQFEYESIDVAVVILVLEVGDFGHDIVPV